MEPKRVVVNINDYSQDLDYYLIINPEVELPKMEDYETLEDASKAMDEFLNSHLEDFIHVSLEDLYHQPIILIGDFNF